MTNKAYIVANEEQEHEVLEELEEKGALWGNGEKTVSPYEDAKDETTE